MEEVKVKVVTGVIPGMEYITTSYGAEGLYILKETMQLVMVSDGCVSSLWRGLPERFLVTAESSSNLSSGVSVETLLKALAIAQDPNLITSI